MLNASIGLRACVYGCLRVCICDAEHRSRAVPMTIKGERAYCVEQYGERVDIIIIHNIGESAQFET